MSIFSHVQDFYSQYSSKNNYFRSPDRPDILWIKIASFGRMWETNK